MKRIGISARLRPGDPLARGGQRKDQWGVEQALCDWLMGRDTLVSVIPPPPPETSKDLASVWINQLDALVLQGGADVGPRTDSTPDRRDAFELKLLDAALSRDLPVLGICRGMQFINVALDGSLRRIEGQTHDGSGVHSDPDLYEAHTHPVCIAPESVHVYGGPGGEVCSMHCHVVDRLGSGIDIEAWCPLDGTVEAIRATGFRWVRGVQWHPEFHAAGLLPAEPLLAEFLQAAGS
jgi:putative glutamine amidotransferase